MAGHDPNYLLFLEEEELYDQAQQLMDEAIGVVEEEEEEEEDEEDEDEDEYEDEEDDDDVEIIPDMTSARVSTTGPSGSSQEAAINQGLGIVVEGNEYSYKKTKGGEDVGSEENVIEGDWNRSEMDGLFCPICMEAWSNGGDHQVCCLPCGHIYGLSCIKRWLQQRRSSGKCPQCNRKCMLKDVRVLYASRIVAIDEELQKKIRSLEAKCAALEKKNADCCKKEVDWQKREADLHQKVYQLTERISYLEGLLKDKPKRPSGSFTADGGCEGQAILGHNLGSEFVKRGCSSSFALQKEFQVDGARHFDVDASSQIIVIARRLSGMGGMHVLTKMSLIAPHEREDIQLPVSTKAVRDLRVSPQSRLALVASLGKKLSVFSTESNNTILSYDLPAAAWSCSWDNSSPHYVYAGLQNGMLLAFDMRQTRRPVESMTGLSYNPIHTIHSLCPDSTISSSVRTLLTASSVGLCEWNFGGVEERPYLVPESENQGVCISLACCPSSNDIVASFRPKVEMFGEVVVSQPFVTPSASLTGRGVSGSHVLYKRVGSQCYQKLGSTCANVDDIRLPKSAIINRENHNSLFACGDEVTSELILQELPSLMVVQHLKSRKHPIRDVKLTHFVNSELLSCLSEDTLQLFSPKLL